MAWRVASLSVVIIASHHVSAVNDVVKISLPSATLKPSSPWRMRVKLPDVLQERHRDHVTIFERGILPVF
jgi:hypothetical protein